MASNRASVSGNNRLRGKIKELYGSYEKLGQEIGVTAQAISEVVNGGTKSATARYAIAKALDSDVEDFWPEEEEAGQPAA